MWWLCLCFVNDIAWHHTDITVTYMKRKQRKGKKAEKTRVNVVEFVYREVTAWRQHFVFCYCHTHSYSITTIHPFSPNVTYLHGGLLNEIGVIIIYE